MYMCFMAAYYLVWANKVVCYRLDWATNILKLYQQVLDKCSS